MGRGPSSQPPGILTSASPVRARMAPRKMIEERISRMSASGTSERLRQDASTVTVVPSRVTRQPRWRRMAIEASTSLRLGQLCRTLTPSASAVAQSRGRTLFFAPWITTWPARRRPPLIS